MAPGDNEVASEPARTQRLQLLDAPWPVLLQKAREGAIGRAWAADLRPLPLAPNPRQSLQSIVSLAISQGLFLSLFHVLGKISLKFSWGPACSEMETEIEAKPHPRPRIFAFRIKSQKMFEIANQASTFVVMFPDFFIGL